MSDNVISFRNGTSYDLSGYLNALAGLKHELRNNTGITIEDIKTISAKTGLSARLLTESSWRGGLTEQELSDRLANLSAWKFTVFSAYADGIRMPNGPAIATALKKYPHINARIFRDKDFDAKRLSYVTDDLITKGIGEKGLRSYWLTKLGIPFELEGSKIVVNIRDIDTDLD